MRSACNPRLAFTVVIIQVTGRLLRARVLYASSPSRPQPPLSLALSSSSHGVSDIRHKQLATGCKARKRFERTRAPCLTLVMIFAASPFVMAAICAALTLSGLLRFSQSFVTMLRCATVAGIRLQAAVLKSLVVHLLNTGFGMSMMECTYPSANDPLTIVAAKLSQPRTASRSVVAVSTFLFFWKGEIFIMAATCEVNVGGL